VLDPAAPNNPPIANTDQAITMQDQPVTLKTLINDRPGDLDAALVPSTVAVTAQPKNGTATVNPTTGDITYTPNAGFVGNDTLYYKVCDNNTPSLCTNAMQVITVNATGSPNSTQGADDFNRTSGNTPATGNVLTNDSDPEKNGQTVTPQSTTLPEGTFVLNADGSYVFTPAPGFSGPVNIPYNVCDNGTPQACTEATLFILVTQSTLSDPGLNIPGGFSPNGDLIDDTYIITRPPGSKVALTVYNRWGNKVFQSNDYQNDWDGRGPGNILGDYVPMGTYYYIVTITDAAGEAKKYSGPLTVVHRK
jgi:gliding motility-associated-like protein